MLGVALAVLIVGVAALLADPVGEPPPSSWQATAHDKGASLTDIYEAG